MQHLCPLHPTGELVALEREISSVPFRMSPRAAKNWNECSALCPLPVKQALLRTVPVAEFNGQSLSQIGRVGHLLEAAAVGNCISLVQMVCSSKFIMEF